MGRDLFDAGKLSPKERAILTRAARIWGATDAGGQMSSFEFIDTDFSITSFGEDESGELYVVDGAGEIYRLTMQGLSLAPPEPGLAGMVNTLYATGATNSRAPSTPS